eukprot:7035047-Pyramimonas_sp.AAC.1
MRVLASFNTGGLVPFGGKYTGNEHTDCPCTNSFTLATLPVSPCDLGGATACCTPCTYWPSKTATPQFLFTCSDNSHPKCNALWFGS